MQVNVSGSGISVKRELEDGWFQNIAMPLPAVLTIQSGINKLRYATLMGIKQAKSKPLATVALADLGVSPSLNRQSVAKLYVPVKTKKTELLEGPAKEVAAQLAARLKNDLRVI